MSTPSRFRLASQQALTYSGRPLIPRTRGSVALRTMPNFVARTTPARRPWMACPTSSSLVNGP